MKRPPRAPGEAAPAPACQTPTTILPTQFPSGAWRAELKFNPNEKRAGAQWKTVWCCHCQTAPVGTESLPLPPIAAGWSYYDAMLRPHADLVKALKSKASTWRMTVGGCGQQPAAGRLALLWPCRSVEPHLAHPPAHLADGSAVRGHLLLHPPQLGGEHQWTLTRFPREYSDIMNNLRALVPGEAALPLCRLHSMRGQVASTGSGLCVTCAATRGANNVMPPACRSAAGAAPHHVHHLP